MKLSDLYAAAEGSIFGFSQTFRRELVWKLLDVLAKADQLANGPQNLVYVRQERLDADRLQQLREAIAALGLDEHI